MHLSSFWLPFDNEGYQALCGFVFLKCHLAVISKYDSMFHTMACKTFGESPERIRAGERQSWGREGIEGFFSISYFLQEKKGHTPPFPFGIYVMTGATCSTSIIP